MKGDFSTAAILAYLKSNAFYPEVLSSSIRELPAITISRQAGARGVTVGERLCERLSLENESGSPPWTLFERNLIAEVLRENELPEALAKYLPEDKVYLVDAMMGEIVGLHPSLWTLQQQCAQTIMRLCHVGHVIIIGRGGNIIARNMPNVLHLRLVGSHDYRVEHMVRNNGMSEHQAQAYIKTEDNGRKRYIQSYFGEDIDNVDLYDEIINTDGFSDESLVDIIVATLHSKCGSAAV